MATYGWRDRNWTKEEVLSWFGDRGIEIPSSSLKKWFWRNGQLWYVVKGKQLNDISETDDGYVDLTKTHRDNKSSISVFELETSLRIEQTPLHDEVIITVRDVRILFDDINKQINNYMNHISPWQRLLVDVLQLDINRFEFRIYFYDNNTVLASASFQELLKSANPLQLLSSRLLSLCQDNDSKRVQLDSIITPSKNASETAIS